MKKITLLLLLSLTLTGCQSVLFTTLYALRGLEEPPQYDILLKGEKRVAVVPRSNYSNSYEAQDAPREIARQVRDILDDEKKTKNKKLRVVEQAKVEAWLDNCDNDFETFAEVGKDKSINADIVIGFDLISFQIRDPQNAYLVQGKCKVEVTAVDCATGKTLAKEILQIVDPPSMPISGGPHVEAGFRPQFIQVISQRVAELFHPHDPRKSHRIDADNLEMHRL